MAVACSKKDTSGFRYIITERRRSLELEVEVIVVVNTREGWFPVANH